VVITDRVSGPSRGFGFVEMSTEAKAQAAIAKLDGQPFEGRRLKVSRAKPTLRSDENGVGSFGSRAILVSGALLAAAGTRQLRRLRPGRSGHRHASPGKSWAGSPELVGSVVAQVPLVPAP
jgi:RNA recognition motif-containing protein